MKIRFTRLLVLFFYFLSASQTLTAGTKPPCIITGPVLVCTNQSASYQVDVNNTAYTYQWVITGGALLSQTANTCAVQWTVAGAGSISVNIYQNGTLINTCTLAVNVYNIPSPNIVPSFEATCSETEDPGGEQIASAGRGKGEDPCSKVCENSTVVYRVSLHAGSTYQWQINGLSYNPPSGTNSNVCTVPWGTVSSGTIQVTETNAAGCSKTVYKCIQIIKAPGAGFTTTPAHDGSQVLICQGQTVTFTDISTAPGNSPIVSWVWDFGDGTGTTTYTAGASVNHQYTNNTGSPFYASLTVKNACGCENTFRIRVFVNISEAPKLVCPSTVCCGKSTGYTITHTPVEPVGCGYMWSVTGGTLLSPGPGQVADAAGIIWDCNATLKTITLIPVNCGGCDNPIVYNINVITTAATVTGRTIVCPNSEEVYSIPSMPGCSFVWSLSNPAAGTIFGGAETNAVKVRWANSFTGTVNLQVHYVNSLLECEGNGQLGITMKPAMGITASPPGSICTGNITFTSRDEYLALVNTSWQINQLPLGNPVHSNAGPVSSTTYNFTAGGDYEVIATDNGGNSCNSPVKFIQTITGNPPVHTGTVNGQTSGICPGQNYMYTATPGSADYNLVWVISPSTAGTVTPASGNKVNIVWSAAGQIQIYQVSKTSPACTSATAHIINVTMVAAPACSITGNFNACPNSTFPYTAPAGYSNYVWTLSPASAGSIIGGQGTNVVSVQWHNTTSAITATLNVAIQYCGSNIQSCTSPTITVSPAPTITITTSNSTICQLNSQLFTVAGISSAASVTWNWGDGATTSGGTSLSASHAYTAPGTYNITVLVTHPNGCFGATSTASLNVTVASKPIVAISLGGSAKTRLCPNDESTAEPALLVATILSGGCGTAGQIQWVKNSTPITGATGNSYMPAWPSTPGSGDVYTFTYTCPGSPCGTVSSPGVLIKREISCDVCTWAGTPTPTITWIRPATTVCGSGNISYTAPAPGFATMLDFDDQTTPLIISPPNTHIGSTTHTYTKAGIYHPTLFTRYPSTNSDGYCDVLKATEAVIPVIAKATVSVVCNPAGGYNIIVTDISDRLATYTATPVRECQLDGNTPINMGSSTTYTFTAIPAGTHTITFRIGVSLTSTSPVYQCEITQPAILPVISTPSINIVQGSPRCVGAPVAFTTNATSVAAYLWQFGDATSSLLPGPTHQYNAAFSPVTVNLQITTNEGCVAANSTTLNIVSNSVGVNISSNAGGSPVSICQSSTPPVLTANISGAVAPVSYTWNTSSLNNISTLNTVVAGNQASDLYLVTVTDAIGCKKTAAPFSVIVKPAPVATILGRDEYCYEEQVILSAQQGAGYTYQWTVNGGNAGTAPSISFTAYAASYTVSLTVSSNGCSATSTITVTVHPNPYVYVSPPFNSSSPTLCAGQPNTITATVTGGTGPYALYWNTTPVLTSNVITVTNAGLYQATVIDAYGCKASDRTRVYKVEDFTNFLSGCYEICNNRSIELVGPKSPSIPADYVPYPIVYGYQWYKNGVLIPPAAGTGANYTVNPTPGPYSGSGQYTLSITSTLPSAGCEVNSLARYEKSFDVAFVECCSTKVEMEIASMTCINYNHDPIRYGIILRVFNPYAGSATLTLNSPNGPLYSIPAAGNLPGSGWNLVMFYLDDMQNTGSFCITGGTITEDATNQTCTFNADICADLPKCDPSLCLTKPNCPCLGDVTGTVRCSGADTIPGYPYVYDFSIMLTWGCRSSATALFSSGCGVFGTVSGDISDGSNVLTGLFYSNQPPGTTCYFTVILFDADNNEICRFCIPLTLSCRFFGRAGQNSFAGTNTANTGNQVSAKAAVTKTTATIQNSNQLNKNTTPAISSAGKELSIVPNPASSIANINYTFSNEGNNSIVLYNLLGTPVKTFTGLPKAGVLRVDISTLPGGTYFVKALGKEKILIAKLEVVR